MLPFAAERSFARSPGSACPVGESGCLVASAIRLKSFDVFHKNLLRPTHAVHNVRHKTPALMFRDRFGIPFLRPLMSVKHPHLAIDRRECGVLRGLPIFHPDKRMFFPSWELAGLPSRIERGAASYPRYVSHH